MRIYDVSTKGEVTIRTYLASAVEVADGSELIPLKCMQMFVHTYEDRRQFAFSEPIETAATKKLIWGSDHNQEEGILEIYMTLDTTTNIFTLYVLASGGYDEGVRNPRPESWPKEANPKGDTDEAAKTAWLGHDYSHHIVYVSRASWKLNNLEGFSWN